MVYDLDLAKSFEKLQEKPIYLFGAGVYAEPVILFLNECHLKIEGIVDSNSELWGKAIKGIEIYPLKELLSVAAEKDIAILITTFRATEVVEILENNIENDVAIYTMYGLIWSIYFNQTLLPCKHEIRKEIMSFFKAYVYKKRIDVYSTQSAFALDTIISILKKPESDIPVIVYQPGKVGSHTIEATLEGCGIPILRAHGVNYPCQYEQTGLDEIFVEKMKRFQNVKIITLVREPISKDIGHFFQKISISENDMGWLVKGIMEKDFQQSFLNYLSVVTPYDFSGGKKDYYSQTVISHIDYIGERNKNGALYGWYEEELKKNLGIDIMEYDFDIDKGYSIIKKDNMEVLVMKLESLSKQESILADFVGVPNLKIVNANEASKKVYKYTYKQFQKEVKLPKAYVDFYYKDKIDYMKHFYSQSEIDNFYSKWKKHIIEL